MKLVSVNVSKPKDLAVRGGVVSTGIFKTPVKGRIAVRFHNLDGDAQADLASHGGRFKAVYAYPIEHYAYWSRTLARDDLAYGQFGENFTVDGMVEKDVCIGDVFRAGSAEFEVSQPRTPCFKLALKMQLPDFPKQFLGSGRIGFYLRVVKEGEVGAGDEIVGVHSDPARLSIAVVNRLMYFERDDLMAISRAVKVEALAPGWRDAFLERLNGL